MIIDPQKKKIFSHGKLHFKRNFLGTAIQWKLFTVRQVYSHCKMFEALASITKSEYTILRKQICRNVSFVLNIPDLFKLLLWSYKYHSRRKAIHTAICKHQEIFARNSKMSLAILSGIKLAKQKRLENIRCCPQAM